MVTNPHPKALSVQAALNVARTLISEQRFRIVGEVSELSNKPGYRAVYFTIKDEKSSLSCMMWKNRFDNAGVPLALGQRVVVDGKFDIYTPKGRMNFTVDALALEGEGELRARVAKLAAQLEKEGLTTAERKRSLVQYPEIVGLVTSPNGAAVHDVLRTMRRRCPFVRVLFAGVRVEGKGAPESIIKGIKTLVDAGAEEIMLVRGGGSFEDLMPFNDELLARTIASCPVPVITGIGHERDTFIADMVGDLRCATPTAVAESIMPHQVDLLSNLGAIAQQMQLSLNNRLRACRDYVNARASRPALKDFMSLYATDLQMVDVLHSSLERGLKNLVRDDLNKLDDYQLRLARALPNAQRQNAQELNQLASRLSQVLPHKMLVMHGEVDALQKSLNTAMSVRFAKDTADLNLKTTTVLHLGQTLVDPFSQQAALVASRINDLSPLRTLERGWSVVKNKEGSIVSSITEVSAGEEVDIQVRDGVLHATINESNSSDFSEMISWKD